MKSLFSDWLDWTFLALDVFFSLASICVGGVYANPTSCPLSRFVAAYLVLVGCVNLPLSVLRAFVDAVKASFALLILNGVLVLFGVGSVFGVIGHVDVVDADSLFFCDEVLFVTAANSAAFHLLFYVFGVFCYFCCRGRNDEDAESVGYRYYLGYIYCALDNLC